jgi:hypothetical protein
MRATRVAAVLALWAACVSAYAVDLSTAVTTSLCDALSRISAGDQVEVNVSGIYETNYEQAVLYDPAQRLCILDVQPATAIEFADTLKISSEFERLIGRDHRAFVTFEGVIAGPSKAGADDPSLPVVMAYANRIANRRHGHMNAFRTQLTVTRLVRFSPVPKSVPRYAESAIKQAADAPVVVRGELPSYPVAAQKAGITGIVVIEVRVHNGQVVAVGLKSGDRLLGSAAQDNVRTWRFEETAEGAFAATFVFELERRLTGSDQNPRLELHLPRYVRVIGKENGW